MGSKFRIDSKGNKTSFSEEEDEVIKQNYLEIPIKTLAKIMKRSSCGIYSRLNHLGCIIPPELAEQRKISGMIKKGTAPPNKGKKQSEYMSPEGIEKSKASRFKKNHIPHNAKQDWEEILRKDYRGTKYWMIKLPENRKLIFKHIWLWESTYGKIPEGYNIIFKNGNSIDCKIENLECISDAELMQKNTIMNFPEDLKQIILLKGKIKRQINKIEKNG